MRVLGIDPGYATIGYGVIEQVGQRNLVKDYGVITTPKDDPMPKRLYQISQGIDRLMDDRHLCGPRARRDPGERLREVRRQSV